MSAVHAFTKLVSVTPVISTSAYTAADQVGGIQTLTSACRMKSANSTLLTLAIIDYAKQAAAMSIFFFPTLPTIVSVDNGAFDLLDAQMATCIGCVTVASTDYQSSASNSIATLKISSCGLMLRSETDAGVLYAVAMTTGTPTYGGVSDLIFKYNFAQDMAV